MTVLVSLACALLAIATLPRRLRVAQREHYLPGSVNWVQQMWFTTSRPSFAMQVVAVGLVVLGAFTAPLLWLLGTALASATPLGLPWRGRTSSLAWTPRLRRVAAVAALLFLVTGLVGLGALTSVLPALVVDAALYVLAPVEKLLSRKYVVAAKERIAKVQPTVVAITGSYGKTSTKNYLAHLLGQTHSLMASPASFNNAMGLSRAVNEGLVPGTELFIAEMGTYGPGEIEALCEVFPPDIAVLTAIGEVHLQRMKDRAGVLEAKSEITVKASSVVVDADDDLLRGLADDCAHRGQHVVRCSTRSTAADVALVEGHLWVHGQDLGPVTLPDTAIAGNAAVALGAALALGDDLRALSRRLANLPTVAHRLEPTAQPGGSWILDDTYNSNPVGAALAVRRATELAVRSGGRVHVITPGMVELGDVQKERNTALGRAIRDGGAATLVVVGRTNAVALVDGGEGGATDVLQVPDRAAAVALVQSRSAPGDVVLFENDLPDHYP